MSLDVPLPRCFWLRYVVRSDVALGWTREDTVSMLQMFFTNREQGSFCG